MYFWQETWLILFILKPNKKVTVLEILFGIMEPDGTSLVGLQERKPDI